MTTIPTRCPYCDRPLATQADYDTARVVEGTWAVFAEKVVAERDAAREEIAELRHKLAGEAAHIASLESLLVDATRERDEARDAAVQAQAALVEARAQLAALRDAALAAMPWMLVITYDPEVTSAGHAAKRKLGVALSDTAHAAEAHDREVAARVLEGAAEEIERAASGIGGEDLTSLEAARAGGLYESEEIVRRLVAKI
jgi:hypothetical protein